MTPAAADSSASSASCLWHFAQELLLSAAEGLDGSQSAPSTGDWHKNQLFPSAAASSPMSTHASPSESSASPDQFMP
eukprot:CAMPEP_0185284292 /NCGR_PEP_ID=MMETSP1363-20130426/996_1 /TAXON_ID=38817 /ORGANISM="Gephyrocapsa oceanica, Strain RCC1303" /LENGTH=76 /DNA_ID=CAMNT_0027879999 /DNA_START=89 /DNA_END=320 /DNA_ORIENTATION=-